jgi:outer membrane protein TolC
MSPRRHAARRAPAALILGAALLAGEAPAAIHELTLAAAVEWAQERSPAARRLALEERQGLLARGVVRARTWPELGLDLQAPILRREFSVGPLPGSGRTTTVITPDGDTLSVVEQVIGKTTTTRRNAAGDLRLQQLLPWRGSLSALGTVYYRDEDTSPEGVYQSRRDYQIDTSIGLDLPLLGDDPARRALRRADVEAEMAGLRARAARASLEFETVSGYLALLRARQSLDIVRGTVDQAVQVQELASRKVAAGLLPEVDLLRMQVNQAEREARLAAAEAELGRAADEFKIFLGLPVADSLVLVEAMESFELHVDLEAAVSRALARRSEIGLAERDVLLLEQDRRAQRPWIPDIALSMRYGGGASDRELDRAVESLSANNVSLLLRLQVPLWDGGRRRLEERSERAGIELRRLELEQARGRIELEVRDAVRQLQDAVRRQRIFEASSRLAEESLRISTERYERGLIDTTAYLNAQAEAVAARLGRTGALLDLYQARARLRLVTVSGEDER